MTTTPSLKLAPQQVQRIQSIRGEIEAAQSRLGTYLQAIADERGLDIQQYTFNLDAGEFAPRAEPPAESAEPTRLNRADRRRATKSRAADATGDVPTISASER